MGDFFIADDLSGALDAAAAFHRAGRRVKVALHLDDWSRSEADEVLGFTTETRNAAPQGAHETVRALLARAVARGETLVYKKIDSTLRGPVGAEVAAVQTALPRSRVLFAPANPKVGRTVRNGLLLVQGVPVAETAFGRDPASPLRSSSIREILGADASGTVIVPDTETGSDLDGAVAEMDEAGGSWVPVGSGALAVAVATRYHGATRPATRSFDVDRSPILMLGGSAHPLNLQQVDQLVKARGVPVQEVSFSKAGGSGEAAGGMLRSAGAGIVRVPAERTSPAVALAGVANAAAEAIAAAGVRRVFATGGETAFALCERLGIDALEFVEEIEPGLSLSVGKAREGVFLLAIKPGGFGDPDTWVRAFDRLSAF